MKTALLLTLKWFVARWPRPGFTLTRLVAWMTAPLGKGISEAQIAAVAPDLAPGEQRAARNRAWSNLLLAEVLIAALARSAAPDTYPRLVRYPTEPTTAPVIMAALHLGAFPAIGAFLERLDCEVIAVNRMRLGPGASFAQLGANEDEWERTRTFHRAMKGLRGGAVVYTTLDGTGEQGFRAATIDVPLLGGTLSMARGAFALARLTRVPIVPVVARWRGSRVEIESGQPIRPSDSEEEMAAQMARWVDGYLRAFPGEISPVTLGQFRRRG